MRAMRAPNPWREVRRRRGRDIRNVELLVEREAERGVLEQQLSDARGGTGSVVVLQGPAGKGKSRLLQLAGDLARRQGLRVLGASGAELERHFPFGIAIQLFEPWWLSAGEGERAATVKGAAAAAGVLLDKGPGEVEPDAGYGTVHGLFRLAAQLALTGGDEAERRAVVMLVDDAQWADGPSLRFLAYLAERLAELPIALVVSMRPGEPGADAAGLAALRVAAADRLLRLRSLSSAAVKRLVTAAFPDADEAFCVACARITGGNPFLLLELLEHVEADGLSPSETTAERLGDLAPQAVLDTVVARLGTLAPAVRAVASAVAVLGDGTALRHVAALADLPSAKVAEAADTLADMHLFCAGEPLSFVHPLIRQAVEQSISPLARGYAARARRGDPRRRRTVRGARRAPPAGGARPGGRPDGRDPPCRRAQGAGQRCREQRRRIAEPGTRRGLQGRSRRASRRAGPGRGPGGPAARARPARRGDRDESRPPPARGARADVGRRSLSRAQLR